MSSQTLMDLHRPDARSDAFGDGVAAPAVARPSFVRARGAIGLPEVAEVDDGVVMLHLAPKPFAKFTPTGIPIHV